MDHAESPFSSLYHKGEKQCPGPGAGPAAVRGGYPLAQRAGFSGTPVHRRDQPVTVTLVMWGLAPSYQYRKPSQSMVWPTSRFFTALYTSVVLSHR